MFSTIEEAFFEIERNLDEETLLNFLSCDYRCLNRYHFGLGLWIRNNLLAGESRLKELFATAGVDTSDDISALVIRLFYIYEKNKKLAEGTDNTQAKDSALSY